MRKRHMLISFNDWLIEKIPDYSGDTNKKQGNLAQKQMNEIVTEENDEKSFSIYEDDIEDCFEKEFVLKEEIKENKKTIFDESDFEKMNQNRNVVNNTFLEYYNDTLNTIMLKYANFFENFFVTKSLLEKSKIKIQNLIFWLNENPEKYISAFVSTYFEYVYVPELNISIGAIHWKKPFFTWKTLSNFEVEPGQFFVSKGCFYVVDQTQLEISYSLEKKNTFRINEKSQIFEIMDVMENFLSANRYKSGLMKSKYMDYLVMNNLDLDLHNSSEMIISKFLKKPITDPQFLLRNSIEITKFTQQLKNKDNLAKYTDRLIKGNPLEANSHSINSRPFYYIIGPTGSGKSFLVYDRAKKLNLKVAAYTQVSNYFDDSVQGDEEIVLFDDLFLTNIDKSLFQVLRQASNYFIPFQFNIKNRQASGYISSVFVTSNQNIYLLSEQVDMPVFQSLKRRIIPLFKDYDGLYEISFKDLYNNYLLTNEPKKEDNNKQSYLMNTFISNRKNIFDNNDGHCVGVDRVGGGGGGSDYDEICRNNNYLNNNDNYADQKKNYFSSFPKTKKVPFDSEKQLYILPTKLSYE